MKMLCNQCGGKIIPGRILPTNVDSFGGTPAVSFVASKGTPTSFNPVTAYMQGIEGEPAFREESVPISGRVCLNCGLVDFRIAPENLAKLISFVKSAETE